MPKYVRKIPFVKISVHAYQFGYKRSKLKPAWGWS